MGRPTRPAAMTNWRKLLEKVQEIRNLNDAREPTLSYNASRNGKMLDEGGVE